MILRIPTVQAGVFARAADLAYQPIREAKVDSSAALPTEALLQAAKDLIAAGHVGGPEDLIEVELAHIIDSDKGEEVFAIRVKSAVEEAFETLLAEPEGAEAPDEGEAAEPVTYLGDAQGSDEPVEEPEPEVVETQPEAPAEAEAEPQDAAEPEASQPEVEVGAPVNPTSGDDAGSQAAPPDEGTEPAGEAA